MAYSQGDLDAIKEAIATGARRVKFGSGPDSREVEYRSLGEMLAVKSLIEAEVSPPAFSPVTFVQHSRE